MSESTTTGLTEGDLLAEFDDVWNMLHDDAHALADSIRTSINRLIHNQQGLGVHGREVIRALLHAEMRMTQTRVALGASRWAATGKLLSDGSYDIPLTGEMADGWYRRVKGEERTLEFKDGCHIRQERWLKHSWNDETRKSTYYLPEWDNPDEEHAAMHKRLEAEREGGCR